MIWETNRDLAILGYKRLDPFRDQVRKLTELVCRSFVAR